MKTEQVLSIKQMQHLQACERLFKCVLYFIIWFFFVKALDLFND